MKEDLIERKSITYTDGFLAEMELSYFLTGKDEESENVFGVRILKDTIENGARVSEDYSTDYVFKNASDALTFLKMLIKYEVTPIALASVLEDYLFDFKAAGNNVSA